jgi:hypothetical protein
MMDSGVLPTIGQSGHPKSYPSDIDEKAGRRLRQNLFGTGVVSTDKPAETSKALPMSG